MLQKWEVIMCTESNLEPCNRGLLRLYHDVDPLFVCNSPPIAKPFWHKRGPLVLMHQVSIGGTRESDSSHPQWFLENSNVAKWQKILENLRKRREDLLFALRVHQSIIRLHLSRMAGESFTSITTNLFALLVFPFLLVNLFSLGETVTSSANPSSLNRGPNSTSTSPV